MVYRVRAPALPLPTPDYLQDQQSQFQNALRLYFNRLDDYLIALSTSGSTGGSQLYFPYGAFSSDQDQTTTANTATLMTLNTTDFANGVYIDNSKITVENSGIYNLQFSTQFQNTDNAFQDVYIWLRQNGLDIPGSTGFVSIPNRHAGTNGHAIVGWNYFLSMTAGNYVEIYWSVPNTDVTIQHLNASGSPTKPSTQSVVATMTFVSNMINLNNISSLLGVSATASVGTVTVTII